jgi:uncharacterized membrane protein (DUF2068 family)
MQAIIPYFSTNSPGLLLPVYVFTIASHNLLALESTHSINLAITQRIATEAREERNR